MKTRMKRMDLDHTGGMRKLAAGIVLAMAAVLGGQAQPVLLTNQHVDILITYDETASEHPLGLAVALEEEGLEYETTDAVLVVGETAEYVLPAGTPFGEEGESLWILPQSPSPDLPFAGVSAEELPQDVFSGPVEIRLKKMEGSGDFYLWQASPSGSLEVKMNSRDGITDTDRVTPLIGSHEHVNWGFSAPGVYTVTFEVTGQRTGESTNITSHLTPMTFHVLPLPESPFVAWQREQFGVEALEETKGPGSDPDGDGLMNLAEYAFGMDPNSAGRSGVPVFQRRAGGESSYGSVRFAHAASATDVEVVVEAAGDLANPDWQVLGERSIIIEGEREWMELVDGIPMEGQGGRFYRITIQMKQHDS